MRNVPEPKLLHEDDVLIQVKATGICGTDLHILGGDVPEVQPGRVLGHEAVAGRCLRAPGRIDGQPVAISSLAGG